MLAYEPQIETWSENLGNTAQSPCTKSSTILFRFSKINNYSNKLTIKIDNSFRLLFENMKGLLLDIEYCPTLWKYK